MWTVAIAAIHLWSGTKVSWDLSELQQLMFASREKNQQRNVGKREYAGTVGEVCDDFVSRWRGPGVGWARLDAESIEYDVEADKIQDKECWATFAYADAGVYILGLCGTEKRTLDEEGSKPGLEVGQERKEAK